MTRRGLLRALAVLPASAVPASVSARDYTSAREVMETIEALSAAVEARLQAILRVVPRSAAFVASVRADLARHRRQRGTAAHPPVHVPDPGSLPRLRAALEELMHAHAEGLPALGNGTAVERLGAHMVDLSRIVTVVDLWIEMEGIE